MHLALDAVFPFRAPNGARSKCRIRVYEPEDERDDVVVVASEMPSNTGTSIANAAEVIAAKVVACYRLPTPLTYNRALSVRGIRALSVRGIWRAR